MIKRLGKRVSLVMDWLFQDLNEDEPLLLRYEEVKALKNDGVPAFRRFLIQLRRGLLRVLRGFLLLLFFSLSAVAVAALLAPFVYPQIYLIIKKVSSPVFLVALLAFLIGSPIYLARGLFKSDEGDVVDPSDGIGFAILLVFFIPAWLVVLAILAYNYLTWLQVILAVLCIPVSLIALLAWTVYKEGKQIK